MDPNNFRLAPAQWAQLRKLLGEALDLPPSARQAWLDALDNEYAPFKARLRTLLAHADGSEPPAFATLPKIETREFAPRVPEGEAGDAVGPYRLVRQIGEGGMATVWLAERADWPEQRRVALKLPHGAWRRAGLMERFARERAILAALEHPHIARLYDAGLTAQGQPYLALEYVEGQPIDLFCRGADGAPRMPVADRVRLFLQVVQAVAYAHGKLVLHRDLKPANILVTPDGSVRLLDFGIAKLLADGATHETQLTRLAGRAMSPGYASPEQIRGEPLSVTSDIFSLGVVLYELLTGVRPFALARNARGEVEQPSSFDDPTRPSDVVPAAERRALRGDLDTIVLQALKHAPARRYQTAFALIDDLERALDGRPVSARPDTLRYRAGKFVRRHRLGVSAGALLLVTLVAGTVGTTVGMLRARDAEAAARTEAATAERYAAILVSMFEVAAPGGNKGRDATAREILLLGAERVRKELANEPLLQVRLLATIGWVHSRQGLLEEAQPLLDEAVGLARALGTKAEVDLAGALVRRGENQRKRNQPGAAEADDREALAILERKYGANDPHLWPATSELASVLRTTDPDQALHFHRRTYDLLVAAHGATDGNAAVVLANIGTMHRRARRYLDAKEAYEHALPNLRQHFGERHPHVATALSNLSIVYRNLGDYARAVDLAKQALVLHQAMSGSDHPDVALDLQTLALASSKVGDPRGALDQMDQSLEILKHRLPADHPWSIQAITTRAALWVEAGRLDDARKALADLDAIQSGGTDTRRSVLNGLVLLAEVERLQNHAERSAALAERVLADPAVRGDRYLEGDARWARAYALAAQGKADAAQADYQLAVALDAASAQSPNFPALIARAKYHVCAGNTTAALAVLNEAVAQGLRDPVVLNDPAFAPVHKRPEFAPIGAAVAPGRTPGAL